MKKKIFQAVKGSRLTDEQAQIYGERIDLIQKSLGRGAAPQDLVEDARDASSPLHSFLDWDNDVAAGKWRLQQANYILRSIDVKIKVVGQHASMGKLLAADLTDIEPSENDEPGTAVITTRAFVNVKNGGVFNQGHEYLGFERVMADEELRTQAIKDALRQLDCWRRKYRQYADDELAAIFAALDQAIVTL